MSRRSQGGTSNLPATVADVARVAGVSGATVSHVLNGTRYVSDETKQKVQRAIEELRYEVNSVAQSLKRNRSQMFGLIVSDIANPFFTAVVRGVEDVAQRRGYNVILCNTDEDPARELRSLQLLHQKRADGVLLSPTGIHHGYLDRLLEAAYPLVCFDRVLPGVSCDAVVLDNVAGSYQAVDHLVALGHRRIGIVGGVGRVGTSTERLEGYRRALLANGIIEEPDLVREGNSRLDGGFARTIDLLELPNPPSAIFVTNNLMTLGAIAALQSRGLRIPGDVAIVGFDDFEWAMILRPRLTTVAQPTYEFGQMAAELLIARIEQGVGDAPRRVLLTPTLRIRESCGAIRVPHQDEFAQVFGSLTAAGHGR
jgi:LacI family transcriptional regulator